MVSIEMEKPKSCNECRFKIPIHPQVSECAAKTNDNYMTDDNPIKDCPLIDLSDDGR